MRCIKCRYVFAEELRICPSCKEDMGNFLEKIGFFPVPFKEPFLFPEDFLESVSSEETSKKEREVEFEIKFPLEET